MLENLKPPVEISTVEYQDLHQQCQLELKQLNQRLVQLERPAMIVLEGLPGNDINRLAERLEASFDPRNSHLYTNPTLLITAEPHHYLRRFWEQVPPSGEIAILAHGWHRRLLHERVAGVVLKTTWKRAVREINQFEAQLTEFGVILLKFFIYTEPPEPEASGSGTGLPENPAAYLEAANEMLIKTSTRLAPWTIISGGIFDHTELEILKACADLLGANLKLDLRAWQNSRPDGKIKSGK